MASIIDTNGAVKGRLALLAKKQAADEDEGTTHTWSMICQATEALLRTVTASSVDNGRVIACIDSLIQSRHQFNDARALSVLAPPPQAHPPRQ